VTSEDRFQQLYDRTVDLLLFGDAHTIEREIRERTTGAGFTFSSPYYYDGMSFYGNETYVECAEERKRHTECSKLKICVLEKTTAFDFIQSTFPSQFFVVASSHIELEDMLVNDTCNVIGNGILLLLDIQDTLLRDSERNFTFANEVDKTDPLAIVTRSTDPEFSGIVNWVVQALFHGEEQELSKNASLCQNYTNLTTPLQASELNILNAVHCVGKYSQVCRGKLCRRNGLNKINDGSTGLLYATPFGDLGREYDDSEDIDVAPYSRLSDIKKKGALNCGVIVPDNFGKKIERCSETVGQVGTRELDGIAGMSVDYCCALGAALFFGDSSVVNLTAFSNNETSFAALGNGIVDVLAGGEVEKKSSFRFSAPYYYGNETRSGDVSSFSLVTRASTEDGLLFSSFVNLVVVATFYAEKESISKKRSKKMPLIPIFRNDFIPKWALRDAIFYTGSYHELYKKNFPAAPDDRGRNQVNDDDGPQIHSFPGLFRK